MNELNRGLRWVAVRLLKTAVLGAVVVGGLQLLILMPFVCCCGCRKADREVLDLEAISHALSLYFQQSGRYPTTSEGLAALVRGRQLEAIPRDPWGHEYAYSGRPNFFRVGSFGGDGAPGGTGDDQDLCITSTSSAVSDDEAAWLVAPCQPIGATYAGPPGSFHRPPKLRSFVSSWRPLRDRAEDT